MLVSDWYDSLCQNEKDLPAEHARFCAAAQYLIQAVIELYNPGSREKFRVTSGWRSFTNNARVGGVSDSLHLVGLARDYVCAAPPAVPPFLQVIAKGNGLYHIQFRICSANRRGLMMRFGL